MRERIRHDGGDLVLPDVGNLHHFCHSFLMSVGRFHRGMHVLDDIQQMEFAKEVVDVLRRELRECASGSLTHPFGVTVVKGVKGVCGPSADNGCRGAGEINPARVEHLRQQLEGYLADAFEHDRNPYSELLSGMSVVHQQRIGIPSSLIRPFPIQVAELASDGVVDGLERAYTGLKRKFRSVDFDDLLNETYLFLYGHPLPEERRYAWVQIDEVQDLSPLQWRIVKGLAARGGVCVYFGDFEQAIFSFLGASSGSLADATADCERHYFRKNFRATPLLLEVLMRYSLDALASEWEFLPQPADHEAQNGLLELSVQRLKGDVRGIGAGLDFGPVLSRADEVLKSGVAENVAILVRTNSMADILEAGVKRLGWRYAKVSGMDLFSYAPMRDFMAFVSLLTEHVPATAWALLARRFSRTICSRAHARYFVRDMFAARWNPILILGEKDPAGIVPRGLSRSAIWAWRHRKELANMRKSLRPAWLAARACICGRCSLRDLFAIFAKIAFGGPKLYFVNELSSGGIVDGDGKVGDCLYSDGINAAKVRIEKFLRYADHVYAGDTRPFAQILAEDWEHLSKLKEADLLVGDEKVVISTIHKAKGRQFDAVFIPDVKDVVAFPLSDPDEAKRLLYVAMSRAKRHLFMWEADDPSVAPLRQCFERGYESYYARRVSGEDLSDDWLDKWERVAEMNARRICDDGVVTALARAVEAPPVVRMAVRALRWSSDDDLRRRVCLELLKESKRGDVVASAISCLADCGMHGEAEFMKVRDVALGSGSPMVLRSALGYFHRMVIFAKGAAIDAIGDFLYSRFPDVRASAAEKLRALGDERWYGVVTGSGADFARLARRQDPAHEPSIRKILAANPKPDKYAKSLRGIIASRACRWL